MVKNALLTKAYILIKGDYKTLNIINVARVGVTRYHNTNLSQSKSFNENYYLPKPDWLHNQLKKQNKNYGF